MLRSSLLRTLPLLALTVFLHGCAIKAATYSPAVNHIDTAKRNAVQPVAMGSFTVKADATGGNSIGLRGNAMSSPVGNDYAAYLADALRQELALAGKLDPKSTLEISGVLLGNDIAAGGFVTNSGFIEARFVVKSNGQVRYDAVKRTETSWDSSFLGAVALPKAQQQYPVLVRDLLGALWSDSQFVNALK